MGIEVGIGFAIGAALAGAGVGMAAAAAIGAVLGSMIVGAVVGAAIGGLSAAITGGDIGKGMLFGAIGGAVMGGVSGYMSNVYGSAATATATTETGTAIGGAGEVASTEFGAMSMAAPEVGAVGELGTVAAAAPEVGAGTGLLEGGAVAGTTAPPSVTTAVPWYKSPEVISGGIKAVGETGAKALMGGTGAEGAAEVTAAASKENLAAQLAAQREIEFGRLAESRAARELPFTEAELARKRRQATLTGVASSPTTATRGLLNA